MAMARLSPHFTLDEMISSQYAARHGIDNTPDEAALKNLTRLAEILERVRAILMSIPLNISSGYRCPELNAAIGGSRNSAHMDGRAADFTCQQFGPPYEVARRLAASGLAFDQVIYEFGRWVHLGIAMAQANPRRQLLTIDRVASRIGIIG